ncbi:MAG: S-layer homology domain-containing protein, partial [Lawsonibacter sp.]|nr:S-layer homology domain-containing protein [Lawsonibacter sp.]
SSGWNDPRDKSDINLMQQAVVMDVPLFAVCRGMQGFNVAMGGGLIQDIPYYLGQKVLSGEINVGRVSAVLSGTLPGSEESVKDTGYTYYNENYEKVGKTYDASTDTYMEGSGCEEGHLRVQVDGLIHSGGTGYHVLKAGNEGIGISRDSKWMYDVAGREFIDLVATAHHQAVNPDKLGNGLTIVASSTDGIVEGIEHQSNLFALAVQFHPERDALGDTRRVDLDNDGIKETPIDVDQDKCNAFLGALVKYAGIYSDRQNQISDDDDSSSTGGSGNSTTPPVVQPTGGNFADVAEGAWYRTAVNYVYGKGLMSGMGNDSFAPDTTLTRAMLAQMLFKLGGAQAGGNSSFTDVDSNAWYAAAVNWAAANGIVSGVGDGSFAPEASITREQLAVMLWKYAGAPSANHDLLNGFTDVGEASDYAVQALAWAVENGIIAGQGNGTLAPGGQATRAQVAQMFMSYLEKRADMPKTA